jgi:hypothetical protein
MRTSPWLAIGSASDMPAVKVVWSGARADFRGADSSTVATFKPIHHDAVLNGLAKELTEFFGAKAKVKKSKAGRSTANQANRRE